MGDGGVDVERKEGWESSVDMMTRSCLWCVGGGREGVKGVMREAEDGEGERRVRRLQITRGARMDVGSARTCRSCRCGCGCGDVVVLWSWF